MWTDAPCSSADMVESISCTRAVAVAVGVEPAMMGGDVMVGWVMGDLKLQQHFESRLTF